MSYERRVGATNRVLQGASRRLFMGPHSSGQAAPRIRNTTAIPRAKPRPAARQHSARTRTTHQPAPVALRTGPTSSAGSATTRGPGGRRNSRLAELASKSIARDGRQAGDRASDTRDIDSSAHRAANRTIIIEGITHESNSIPHIRRSGSPRTGRYRQTATRPGPDPDRGSRGRRQSPRLETA